jgi:hypothetical protein
MIGGTEDHSAENQVNSKCKMRSRETAEISYDQAISISIINIYLGVFQNNNQVFTTKLAS